jgi:hypothetical protein
MRQNTEGMLTIGIRSLYPLASLWASGAEPTAERPTGVGPSGAWVAAAQLLS